MYQVVAPQSYDVTGWSYHSRGLKPGYPSAVPGAAQPVSRKGLCSIGYQTKAYRESGTRRYNDSGRVLPGAVFYDEAGYRHVMTGQISNGQYLRTYECGTRNFRRIDPDLIN